jgi:flagellar assembly protein FliH
LSNVIKAYSVRYGEEEKKTIDSHLKRDPDIQVLRNSRIAVIEDNSGFVEGLKAVVVDPVPSDEELSEKTVKIIEDARKEAKSIIDKARLEAEQIKTETLANAKKKGYEEGQLQSQKEAQKKQAELEQLRRRQEQEYDALVEELEPRMAEIMADMIGKITGILVEDRQEVILYLVERAFLNMDKADSYTIRVSREDYEFLSGKKDYLTDLSGREINLFITEDASLIKNQCRIETELKVIDCSLDVQLTNLITDIKLLGGI